MPFAPEEVRAFGDWLECESLRQMILESRPNLAPYVVLHPHRPLLRIHRPAGDVLIARMHESEPAPWLVGVREGPSHALHEVDTSPAVAALVIGLLDTE